MLNTLLPYVCSTQRDTNSLVDGEQIKSYSTIYSNIKCRYYAVKGKITNTPLASETQSNSYNVIIEKDKTNILIGDKIIIEGKNFIVEDVKKQILFNSIDHVFLLVKQL